MNEVVMYAFKHTTRCRMRTLQACQPSERALAGRLTRLAITRGRFAGCS